MRRACSIICVLKVSKSPTNIILCAHHRILKNYISMINRDFLFTITCMITKYLLLSANIYTLIYHPLVLKATYVIIVYKHRRSIGARGCAESANSTGPRALMGYLYKFKTIIIGL